MVDVAEAGRFERPCRFITGPSDFESAPFGLSGTLPGLLGWRMHWDSNPGAGSSPTVA